MSIRLQAIGWPVLVSLMLITNGGLIWRDARRTERLQESLLRIQDLQITIRALESEKVFGGPFVSSFEGMDLERNPSHIPGFGEQKLVLVFFRTYDCVSCLKDIGTIKKNIASVPVVGIICSDDSAAVQKAIREYAYDFPIYIGTNLPFQLYHTPYMVVLGGSREILYLDKVTPTNTVARITQNISSLIQAP